MGGGCQGCAVSAVTLRQGIERAIRQAAPEIEQIIDITAHEEGENPYYASSPAEGAAASPIAK
jgi:Fe-S cluster biogenesis protein NfuA